MATVVIRPATVADANGLAELVTQLGYPTSAEQMKSRLEAILLDSEYATLVAAEGQTLTGFVGIREGILYEGDERYAQIMALAVASDRRRHGIGRRLIQSAESMPAQRGIRSIVLTTGNQRAGAHAFYEDNGYVFTGRRYTKSLSSG